MSHFKPETILCFDSFKGCEASDSDEVNARAEHNERKASETGGPLAFSNAGIQ
jgi:hypothetical protein